MTDQVPPSTASVLTDEFVDVSIHLHICFLPLILKINLMKKVSGGQ